MCCRTGVLFSFSELFVADDEFCYHNSAFTILIPGGQAICRALMKNCTLETINIGSNELSEPTAAALAQILIHNGTLVNINVSCNRLGQVCIILL